MSNQSGGNHDHRPRLNFNTKNDGCGKDLVFSNPPRVLGCTRISTGLCVQSKLKTKPKRHSCKLEGFGLGKINGAEFEIQILHVHASM